MQQTDTPLTIPNHIAIIMDGNGRWAKKRGLPRQMGHRQGAKSVKNVVLRCKELGVKYLTLFAFSTENWNRPRDEVDSIMNLMRDYLNNLESYSDQNVKLSVIGSREGLDEDLVKKIADAEEKSASCDGLYLNVAINYGGREEILRAVRQIGGDIKEGRLEPLQIDAEIFSRSLYTVGQPDPDMIIRPSGEERISNFLLWQCAYSEFIFIDTLWPDFTSDDLDAAIAKYNKRSRRFGGI